MNEKEKKSIEDMNRFANGIDMSCVTARQMQIILNLIEKLLKENEELKEKIREQTLLISPYYVKENYIPIQKVKDKIRHYQELQDNYIKKYDEINEGLQTMINVLQELIEESED